MELFYAHPKNISGKSIILDSFEANHLIKTLRKKIGDLINITDGEGNHYSGIIDGVKPDLVVTIDSQKHIEKRGIDISLGIAFIRPNRLEFILEKGTELGVGSFYIFKSEHANYFSNNQKKFEKVLRQAIKQSNRFWLPKLYLCKDIDSFINETEDIPFKIAAIDSASPEMSYRISEKSNDETLLCIGPEGGFSESEVLLFKENGFKDVSLGSYRLRTETAALAGIARLVL